VRHPEPEITPRSLCWRCHRARSACFCPQVRPFASGPKVVVLLHPKEHKHRVGTARIVELGIQDAQVLRGHGRDFDQDPRLLSLLEDPTLHAMILYPGPRATALESASPELVPEGRRLLVIAIDGTWAHAKKMIRESRVLSSLPQLAFTPTQRSRYRFREQPADLCVSTVEAVHSVIELLHRQSIYPLPEGRAHDNLLHVFDWLVEFQLRAQSLGRVEPQAPGASTGVGQPG